MRAKKKLGQHFLHSKKALTAIIEAAAIAPRDTILEIGPGTGVLTRALLETGAHIIAVEADKDMCEILSKDFRTALKAEQLNLIEGDVRERAFADLIGNKPYSIVANIPYYITGELLRLFLTHQHQPKSMTLLVQKEVAERIACPGRARSKKETVLSLSVKAYGTPRYVMTVPARYFNPPPKVDSAVLHIDYISRNFFADVSEERFFKVVKAGFLSKRKTLANNLAGFGGKTQVTTILAQLGLPANIRAEDVSLEEWRHIAAMFS